MPKSSQVTYETVAKVADDLVKAGVTPSQRALVERVGGSNSTIGPLLRQWKAARSAAASTSSETPHHLEVDIAVANVLRRAQAEVRDELQGDLDDQVREIEQLTSERDSARASVTELTAANAGLQRQCDQQAGQLTEVRRELQDAGAARQAVGQAVETLRGELGQASAAKAALEGRLAQAEDSAERAAGALKDAQHRSDAAAAAQAAAEQALATSRAELEAKLEVERRARSDLEQRVTTLRETIDGHLPKLERLAAAEASERLLRDQVGTLERMLDSAGQRASAAQAAGGSAAA
jgi:chromosome segregation ATPase